MMKKYKSSGIIMVVLCCCMAGCSGNSSESNTSEPDQSATAETAPDIGKMLFEDKCTACHGADGTAQIGHAANLQTSKLDSASMITIIIQGKNAMPSFKDQLSRGEAEKLTKYLHALRK